MMFFTVQEDQFDETKPPEKKKGVFCDSSDRFEIALAFDGKNTGFGTIKAGKSWIRSFGLHYYPLGQMENYGIDRDNANLKDVTLVQEKDTFSITGWTRLVRREIWTELNLIRNNNAIDIFLRIENFGIQDPLALAFFIVGEKILVGDQEMRSGTLTRFKGESKLVVSHTENETLQIIPISPSSMQIIPLAGKNHFWGSDFLIAFDILDFTSRFHIQIV